ncbi:hypothetical protein PIB30_102746 [Stylosanthes scabra]|uniref:Uncharacterized protein n=1 Tax=Stylosanthes scabra TaxID=79078 RepID=A0ABU6YVJ0_9FABA|nr:hypothetical protein [Stylosanthes scabra]
MMMDSGLRGFVSGLGRSDERRLLIDPAISLHPSRQYFEWYKERTRRFLCNPLSFYHPRLVDIPPEAAVGYGDSPVVAWLDVPQDRRHLSSRVRHARQAQQQHPNGDDLPQQPQQDDAPPHGSPQYPDTQYYCPQPFDATQAQPMFDFLHGASSYELGSFSQVHDGTQDMYETAARNHGYWPNFSSFFEGIDQFIPTRPSPLTSADLGLTLIASAMQAPHIPGRHSVSHIDTTGSTFRHYDLDAMQGRHLSFVDDTSQKEPQGRPRRARHPPSCGTGGRLGHDGHC